MWTPMEPQEATVQPLSSVWRGVSRVVFWALQASAREVHLHVSERGVPIRGARDMPV